MGDAMTRVNAWQGRTHHFSCPVCDGDLHYRDKVRIGPRVAEYDLSCPDCGAPLVIHSRPNHIKVLLSAIVWFLILAMNFSQMGSDFTLATILSAAMFLLIAFVSLFIRQYEIVIVVQPGDAHPRGPRPVPFAGDQSSVAQAADQFTKLLKSKRGPMDTVGRWCFIVGVLVIAGCFTVDSHLNAYSALAWLVEWTGLSILLRDAHSPIVTIGGGLLISCVSLLFAAQLGQWLGAAVSMI